MFFLRYSYCKAEYFRCILISQFWNVEILKFGMFPVLMGKLNFLRVLNFTILSYSRNLREFDSSEKCFMVLIYYFFLNLQSQLSFCQKKLSIVSSYQVILFLRPSCLRHGRYLINIVFILLIIYNRIVLQIIQDDSEISFGYCVLLCVCVCCKI